MRTTRFCGFGGSGPGGSCPGGRRVCGWGPGERYGTTPPPPPVNRQTRVKHYLPETWFARGNNYIFQNNNSQNCPSCINIIPSPQWLLRTRNVRYNIDLLISKQCCVKLRYHKITSNVRKCPELSISVDNITVFHWSCKLRGEVEPIDSLIAKIHLVCISSNWSVNSFDCQQWAWCQYTIGIVLPGHIDPTT